jgi:hypothetical protein
MYLHPAQPHPAQHPLIRAITSFSADELARLTCMVEGCDFGPVVFVSPSILLHCHRCGEELMGRTIDDLEPMTDEDYDLLNVLDDMDRFDDRVEVR